MSYGLRLSWLSAFLPMQIAPLEPADVQLQRAPIEDRDPVRADDLHPRHSLEIVMGIFVKETRPDIVFSTIGSRCANKHCHPSTIQSRGVAQEVGRQLRHADSSSWPGCER